MHASCYRLVLLSAVVLLASARPVLANSIAPTIGFVPGLLPFALWMALPDSVLAAFLERPFVSRAGVSQLALWYSLQANLFSLVIGYLSLPVALAALHTVGPLWSPLAVAISVLSEGVYYQLRAIEGAQRLRWRWVVSGNVFSSLVLLLLPMAAQALKVARPSLAWELAPYEDVLLWGSVAASLAVFAASCFIPALLRWKQAVPIPPLHLSAPFGAVAPGLVDPVAAVGGRVHADDLLRPA